MDGWINEGRRGDSFSKDQNILHYNSQKILNSEKIKVTSLKMYFTHKLHSQETYHTTLDVHHYHQNTEAGLHYTVAYHLYILVHHDKGNSQEDILQGVGYLL